MHLTLISTLISSQGIIQASDSNITSSAGQVDVGPKVFRLGFAHGALALAGTYSVDSTRMDIWLPNFIARYATLPGPSLAGFANHLAAELESSATPDEPRLFHIAGYVNGPGGMHPEFYFVRNIQGINATTGDYEGFTSTYQVSEDFWTRDYLKIPAGALAAGEYYRYFNGFAPGRIAYLGATQLLRAFYEQVWNQPGWEFRRPSSLHELGHLCPT